MEKESSLITSTNKFSFFKNINSKLNIDKHVQGLLKDDGTFTSDPFEIAQMFNDYFASVYTIDNGTNPNFEKRTNSELGSVLFSGQSVHHVLKKLKRCHSSGPYGFPNALLKNMAKVLSAPLALLFERSMAVVSIPKIWKTARIVPMERIITDQLMFYLSDYNLLSSQQFGCRKNSSIKMQLLDCYNDLSPAKNAGNSVDVIYLDFAKAFDSVVHSKLLLKLAAYGICGNLLTWIKCFLTD